jgi:spectinomycin phosphotransferase
MLEPPADLSNETLRACLDAEYRLAIADLTFLPIGHDASAWVYRAQTADGSASFVKVRRSVTNHASLLVPRYLHDHGVAQVVAPLPTAGSALWTQAGSYAVILYPFVESRTGMHGGMSDRQWIEYGGLLRQIHETSPSAELARVMRRDDLTPDGAAVLRRLDADAVADAFGDDPSARTLRTFWLERRDLIQTVLDRAEALGRRLARRASPFILCHADVHTDNVLIDTKQRVWIVDWDETILAPRERDLMFAIGGISRRLVGPRQEALFLQGYGQEYGAVDVDPLALAYYRYAWAVSDISAYGQQIVYRPDFGPLTRGRDTELLMSLFAPGEIVSIALESSPALA